MKEQILGIWDQSYQNLGDKQCDIFFICYEASMWDELYR